MLVLTTMVVLLIAGLAYLAYPHWSAYLMITFVVVLVYAAYRSWKADKKRVRISNQYKHPRLDDGPAPMPIMPDRRAGDATRDPFNM